MGRNYELKRRAEQMEETRLRIVEAAIELHEELGPAQTSISAIADRAGVQRQTYYRHFPDERSLLSACSSLHTERNPMPDPATWDEPDPEARLQRGLTELYAYFAANEAMLASVTRDAEFHALTRETVVRHMQPGLERIQRALAQGLGRSQRVRAAIAVVTRFDAWRTLAREQQLGERATADTAVAMVLGAARRGGDPATFPAWRARAVHPPSGRGA